ncbi:MAG TPA: M28 family peptidase [Rectinemataceae bacterium]|nr:M28 family peptidase [Rectinemataceae bacterium]
MSSRPGPLDSEADLDESFQAFMAPGCDRLVRLIGMLARVGLEGRVLAIGERRHLLVRLRQGPPSIILVAHYDRVDGSPGALDNSAACFVLARAGRRIRSDPRARKGILLLFTDGEEAALENPLSQGAYALATGLKKVIGKARPQIFILDVVGRGSRLIVSTASRPGWEGQGDVAKSLLDAMEGRAGAAAIRLGMASPVRLPLPWSDDLGFALAGMPSLALSLLPSLELEGLLHGLSLVSSPSVARLPSRAELGPAWPSTWERLHGPDDLPESLEGPSLALMEEFCAGLCREEGSEAIARQAPRRSHISGADKSH